MVWLAPWTPQMLNQMRKSRKIFIYSQFCPFFQRFLYFCYFFFNIFFQFFLNVFQALSIFLIFAFSIGTFTIGLSKTKRKLGRLTKKPKENSGIVVGGSAPTPHRAFCVSLLAPIDSPICCYCFCLSAIKSEQGLTIKLFIGNPPK